MRSRKRVLILVAAALLSCLGGSIGAADGGKYTLLVLEGRVTVPGGALELTSQFDPVVFAVSSVQNKYRLIRVQLRNRGSQPLPLAATKDKLEAVMEKGAVAGILDLASKDAAVWDALPAAARKALAYPAMVAAGEEEGIFVFVLSAQAPAAPSELRYTLDSVPQKPIVLRRRGAAAA
ncbi:MAG TPA: hypothetical protein VHB47_08130 [Thermoanaerobaculia bacterium]|nr:hypothetical protein [Thermoanaerobaculia bacterium]